MQIQSASKARAEQGGTVGGLLSTAVPTYSLDGLRVLDIGCNDGNVFNLAQFAGADCYGVDVDRAAIARGNALYSFKITVGTAESLPFQNEMFDVVMSRVSLPYAHIPSALSEAFRVLRPDGRLFLSMHDLRLQMEFLNAALASRSVKRIIDHAYIFSASTIFNFTGACLSRPWKRSGKQYETFQTTGRMFKELVRAGFSDPSARHMDHHYILEASKGQNEANFALLRGRNIGVSVR